MEHKKTIKNHNQHKIKNEIQELEKLIPLVTESTDILKKLGAESIAQFEFSINETSGFVKASLSAEAYGFENEYSRLLELEKLIDSKLLPANLTSSNKLKSSLTKEIEVKHIEYFTEDELKLKETLDKVISIYNQLPLVDRKNIGYGREYNLVYNPFSELK